MFVTLMLVAAAPHSFIVEGSRGAANDHRVLVEALRAPVPAARSGQTRYCFDDTITQAETPRRVCRTRQAWRRYGLDPVAS